MRHLTSSSKFAACLLGALALVLFASSAGALVIITDPTPNTALTLADLLGIGTPNGEKGAIQIDDKHFCDFSGGIFNASGGATPIDPALVFLSSDPAGEGTQEPGPGLRFQL